MTDRMALLERVAEAAREVQMWQPDRMTQPSAAYSAWGKLNNALDALRFAPALPAEPVGKTVTMALIRSRRNGGLGGTMYPDQEDPRDWEHIGYITFPMPPAIIIPTVAARVEG